MDKESILEMSRQENKNKDLVDRSLELTAFSVAAIAMSVMCLIFYAVQIAIQGTCNWGFFAIISLYNGLMYLVKGIKMSKKSNIIAGIVWLILTIVLCVGHINTLIATSTIL